MPGPYSHLEIDCNSKYETVRDHVFAFPCAAFPLYVKIWFFLWRLLKRLVHDKVVIIWALFATKFCLLYSQLIIFRYSYSWPSVDVIMYPEERVHKNSCKLCTDWNVTHQISEQELTFVAYKLCYIEDSLAELCKCSIYHCYIANVVHNTSAE